MKIARLAGLMLVAVMAVSLAVASAAFAEPEFKPTGGTFTGVGLGSNVLTAGGNVITCTANSTKGTISSATLAGGVVVTFTGCASSGSGGSGCAASSTGAAAGTIATTTLHGVLGLILPKGTGTGVGLLLLPVANKKFVTINGNTCTVETTVTGNVAGEVIPVGHSQATGKLLFQAASSGGGESIKSFDPTTGGTVTPEIEAFGLAASQQTTEDLTFSAAVEVS
jgi:hypothetical protein